MKQLERKARLLYDMVWLLCDLKVYDKRGKNCRELFESLYSPLQVLWPSSTVLSLRFLICKMGMLINTSKHFFPYYIVKVDIALDRCLSGLQYYGNLYQPNELIIFKVVIKHALTNYTAL